MHIGNNTNVNFQKQDLQSELEGNKKTYEGMKMEAEEQVILLRQQIVALRKALADAQKEANDVRKLLDKEVRTSFITETTDCRLEEGPC